MNKSLSFVLESLTASESSEDSLLVKSSIQYSYSKNYETYLIGAEVYLAALPIFSM